jgi:hypothetical protein
MSNICRGDIWVIKHVRENPGIHSGDESTL